jgi:nucleotide sugar dehydrogenase
VLFSVLGEVRPVASPETAEALKLFANVQRDTAFALANQFALICEDVGVDFAELREAGAAGLPHFTMARPGPVGGPCLSKDVFLLLQPASGQEFGAELLLAARAVNARLVGRFSAAIRADLAAAGGGTVAILGLAFKGRPPVSDRADSFGVALQAELIAAEISVKTWDPVSDPPEARASAIEGADVVVLANDHHALVDISDIARESPGCVVYDICGTADRRSASDLVLRVFGDGATRR